MDSPHAPGIIHREEHETRQLCRNSVDLEAANICCYELSARATGEIPFHLPDKPVKFNIN